MLKTAPLYAPLASALLLGLAACGSKVKTHEGASTTARIAFQNDTNAANANGAMAPSYLGLKVVSIKLMADKDNCDTTVCPTIWVSEACEAHKSTESLGTASFSYLVPEPCADGKVAYLDFAQPTSALAARLNARPQAVVPGTYNYLQITFAEGPLQREALEFKAPGMNEPFAAKIKGLWAIESLKAREPLVIKEGDDVAIDVRYDLAGTVTAEADGSYCYRNETTTRCQSYPKFNISLHRQVQEKNASLLKDDRKDL